MSKRKRLSDSEKFLAEFREALEVLGPVEATEVVAEIGSHLAEATTEAGGDQKAALEQFGSPTVLATRILHERGALSGEGSVREAPMWMRFTAVAIDGARWLILLWLLLGWTLFMGVPVDPSAAPVAMVLAWAYIAVVIAGTVWWWVGRRRSKATGGMTALGLRRVRLGDTTRVVRERDIPGAGQSVFTRRASIVWALIVLLVFGWWIFGLVSSARDTNQSNRQAEIQMALDDSTQAITIIQGVYTALEQGQGISSWFSPGAAAGAADLTARYTTKPFDHYVVSRVEVPDYEPIQFDEDPTGRRIDVYVTVTEFDKVGTSAGYRFKVVERVTRAESDRNAGFIETRILIEEVASL